MAISDALRDKAMGHARDTDSPTAAPQTAAQAMQPQSTGSAAFDSQYGPWAWALNHPEIGPKLREAETGNWTPEQLQAAIVSTEWWKTTAPSARAWIRTSSLDPASAQDKVRGRYSQVWDIAHRIHGNWNASGQQWLTTVAEHAERLGWTDQEVADLIVDQVRPEWLSGSTGALKSTSDQLRTMAAQYATPVGDDWLFDFSQRVAKGERSVDDAAAFFKDQALARFPTLKPVLDAGFTVRQYVEPYVQDTARELGINAADIDLVDPKWSRMLDGNTDKQTGMRTAYSRDEWVAELRTKEQYGWDRTQGAKDQALQLRSELRKTFGLEA